MPISVLDIAVLGVVVISAVLAAVRGFAREVLAVSAWVIAAAAALFLHKSLLPFTHQYISHETIALGVTIAGIFIVTLVIMSLITVQISDLVLDSRIGALDRTLGLIFGIARGFLICVIGWVLFGVFLLQGKVPDWAATARTRPMLESTGDGIVSFFKSNADGWLDMARSKLGSANEPKESPPEAPVTPESPAPAHGSGGATSTH